MTKLSCPSCGARYNVPDEKLGKSVKCAKCGERFQLAAPETDDLGFLELESLQVGQAMPTAPIAPRPVSMAVSKALEPVEIVGAAALAQYLKDVFGFFRMLIQPWELLTLAAVCGICLLQVVAGYAGCLGLAAKIIISGWYLSFLLKTVQSGAARDEGLPDFSLSDGVFDDIILPCLSFLAVRLIAVLPLIGALIFASNDGRLPGEIAGVIGFLGVTMPEMALITTILLADEVPGLVGVVAPALLIGMAAVPMLVLVVAIAGISSLARVDLMMATILRTVPGYLAATLIYFASLAAAVGVGYVAEETLSGGSTISAAAATDAADPNSADPNAAANTSPPSGVASPGGASSKTPDATADLMGSLAGQILAMIASVISSVFAMRAIGLYYAHFKKNFAWSWG